MFSCRMPTRSSTSRCGKRTFSVMFTSYWKTITKTGSGQTYKEPLKEEAVYAGVLCAVRKFWRFKNGRNGRASQPPLAPAAAGKKTHIGFAPFTYKNEHLRLKTINLPRQARDEQREKALQKSDLFSYAGARVFPARSRALAVSCQSCRRLYGKVKTNAFFGASLMHTHDEVYQDRLGTNI